MQMAALMQTQKHCQRRKAQLEQELAAALAAAQDAGYQVDPSANFQLSQQGKWHAAACLSFFIHSL